MNKPNVIKRAIIDQERETLGRELLQKLPLPLELCEVIGDFVFGEPYDDKYMPFLCVIGECRAYPHPDCVCGDDIEAQNEAEWAKIYEENPDLLLE